MKIRTLLVDDQSTCLAVLRDILRYESVKELHPLFHGEYTVALHNGARATLTRGYREQLRQLGVTA